jgi:putative ABC transport system ATP-binding protein
MHTTIPLVVDDLVVELTSGPHTARPIDHLSFTAAAGTLTVLLGPSGCGKTTLLSCLGGLLPPTSGSVAVAGAELTGMSGRRHAEHRRHRVGVVFQAFNLVASLDALENVMVPLRVAGVSTSLARGLATQALLHVGMSGHRHHRPAQLSGGQQQRVAIARAIVTDAPLLLADRTPGSAAGGRRAAAAALAGRRRPYPGGGHPRRSHAALRRSGASHATHGRAA